VFSDRRADQSGTDLFTLGAHHLEAAVRSRDDLLDFLNDSAATHARARPAPLDAVALAQVTAFWCKAENICSI
jgi:hypothetical protein